MPEHTSFLTLLLEHAKETLAHNAGFLGNSFVEGRPPEWQSAEPIVAAALVALALVIIGLVSRAGFRRGNGASGRRLFSTWDARCRA